MKKTRNIVRYLMVLVLNILILFLFQSYVNFLLLILQLVTPVYSIWAVRKVSRSLTFKLRGPMEPVEKGSLFYLYLQLENSSWHPLLNATIGITMENSFYQEKGKHELNLPVRAKRETKTEYPILMEYCGCLQVQAEQIRLLDLLGIYEMTIPVSVQQEYLVFPCGEPYHQEVGRIYQNGVTEAMESKEKGYDFSEVSGIREYIPGDKLQNIHWKLSVKKDQLMVKERISVSAMQLNVLIELENNEEMCVEAVLELADGVTKSLVAQNLPFTVWYYSTNLGELKAAYIGNETERRQWMEELLYNSCYEIEPIAEESYKSCNGQESSYLYIGCVDDLEGAEYRIVGKGKVGAVLKK